MLHAIYLPINRRIATLALTVLITACGGGEPGTATSAGIRQGQPAASASQQPAAPQQPPAGGTQAATGDAALARFDNPTGIVAAANGDLYVADTGNDAIRRVAPGNTVTTLAGSARQIRSPQGVTADAAGNIYFTDSGNHAIRKITPGGSMTTFAGTAGAQGFADVQ